ncbi:MAG: hypothetical protein HQ509_07530 [Candidatus Marinimicrobia bacterium]|nr:hypothetical protein [Candidatus Neomarinimicrobiota bacterium]
MKIPEMKNSSQLILILMVFSGLMGSETDTIYILHTNNTNGELENCYCPDHPLGSLEKRAVFIEQFRKNHTNTLLVDAGDFWNVTSRLPQKDKLVSTAYSFMDYDAILLGDQELIRQNDIFPDALLNMKSDIIVSNLLNPRIPGTQMYKIVHFGDISVGIVGIVGPASFKYYPKEIREKIDLKSPELVLGELIPTLRETCDIILVLSHQGLDSDINLAKKGLDIDIIIGAHSQTVLDSITQIGNTVIGQAGKDGYYVGVIKLIVDKSRSVLKSEAWLELMTLDMPDDPRVLKLIQEFETESGIVNRRKKEYIQR